MLLQGKIYLIKKEEGKIKVYYLFSILLRALEVLKPLVIPTDESNEINSSNNNIDDPNADLKSPISLVHETALKRNLQVIFEVKLEKGPPHMKTFVTLCKVGNVVVSLGLFSPFFNAS